MKRLMRKLLIGIYVFLLCLGIPKQSLVTQALEEQVTIYDFVANEASGDFLQQFTQIGQFNEYGIAIVSVENGVDYDNNPSFLYGLINLEGALVLPVEYSSIRDFNNSLYYVSKYSEVHNPFNNGLVSKLDGSIVLEPKYIWFDYFKNNTLVSFQYSPTNKFSNMYQETFHYLSGKLVKMNYSQLTSGYTSVSIVENMAGYCYQMTATRGTYQDNTFESINFLVDHEGNLLTNYDLFRSLESYLVFNNILYIITRDKDDATKKSLIKIEKDFVTEIIDKKDMIFYRANENRFYYDNGWMDFETLTHHEEILIDQDGPLEIIKVGNFYQLHDSDGNSLLPSEYDVISIAYEGALDWYRFSIIDTFKNIDNEEETEDVMVDGFYSAPQLKVVLNPEYLSLNDKVRDLIKNGYTTIHKLNGFYKYYRYPTFTAKSYITKSGLLKIDGTLAVEPIYDYIQPPNGDGLVEYGLSTITVTDGQPTVTDRGVFDVTQMKVLVPGGVDMLQPYYETMNYTVTPLFDENGHIRLVDSSNDYSSEHNVELQGILSREGIIYPVEYLNAYYRNGLYYLMQKDGTWLLENRDKSYRLTLDLNEIDIGFDGSIEAVNKYSDFYIIETSFQDTIGVQTRFGVLNNDLSIHLPFEFTNISVDGTLLSLERYNEVSLKTEVAVYDISTQTYVVPFGNKYESMSEYVGGVAIGQSGTAEMPVTTFMFGLNVNATEDDFVLDILNENGFVVGDLSNKYSETLLLGQNKEGIAQAMVKKDGQYYLASLQTTQVPLKAIESVTLLQSNLNLKAGEVAQLNGIIKPLDANEPVKVIWESSDASIVAVDGKGQIKALKDGSAIVIFKVNKHVASVSIKVGETIVPPVTPPSPPVTPPIPPINPNQGPIMMPPAPKPPVLNIIQPLFALLSQKNVRFSQFEATLKKAYENNPDFLDNLSESELERFEEMMFEFYNDKLNIEIDEGIEIEDILGLIDFGSLIDNKPFSLGLHFSEDIDETDKLLVNEYMNLNHLSEDNVLFLNIEFLINDVLQTELSNPITIRMHIPDALKDVKDLKVLRVHNGVVSVLNVTYLDNGQISFETDRFSMYALVKSTPVSIPVTTSDLLASNSNNFPWLSIMLGILVVIVSGVLFVYRKRVQI